MALASDHLYRVALGISEEHWVSARQAAEGIGGFFRYTVRVRRRQHGVTIEWMKSVPVGSGSGKRLAFRSITRGEGLRYRRSMFLEAMSWEKPIIMAAEEGFGDVRAASALLSQAGRRLGWIRKVVDRGGDVEPQRLSEVLRQVAGACAAVSGLDGDY
jgi:hypothetical protein